MNVVFCTTCKGRSYHIAETLPRNLADNPKSKFVVVDYGDGPDLQAVLEPLKCDRLIVYRYETKGPFNVAHAKNLAARLGLREGADVLVTLDADNFTGAGFEDFIEEKLKEPGVFLTPDHEAIRKMSWEPEAGRPNRGFAGRLAIRGQEFLKAGGYNEEYNVWRGEDVDLNARLGRMGYQRRFIDIGFLKTIPHNANVRFREYPQAREFDVIGAWRIAGREHDTVVNYGQFGLGIVYRNYGSEPTELGPVPTRIFGIGMQKTATTSLHKAFQLLGFDSLHWGSGEVPLIWDEVNSAGRSITLERFYALSDNPIPLLYKKLDQAYPGSKFILTIRDEASWLKSVERLWDHRYNPTRWQWDVWPISNRIHKALYGRTDFNAETMLATYRRHNAEVVEYFKGRPNALLIMDMSDNHPKRLWWLLCTFLDLPIPAGSYPHEYKTQLKREPFDS